MEYTLNNSVLKSLYFSISYCYKWQLEISCVSLRLLGTFEPPANWYIIFELLSMSVVLVKTRKCTLCWHILFLSNIRYHKHGFWLPSSWWEWECVWVQHPSVPAYMPEGQMTTWWFHIVVPLVGFLLVDQVVTFNWPWTGSFDQDNWMLNCELT